MFFNKNTYLYFSLTKIRCATLATKINYKYLSCCLFQLCMSE